MKNIIKKITLAFVVFIPVLCFAQDINVSKLNKEAKAKTEAMSAKNKENFKQILSLLKKGKKAEALILIKKANDENPSFLTSLYSYPRSNILGTPLSLLMSLEKNMDKAWFPDERKNPMFTEQEIIDMANLNKESITVRLPVYDEPIPFEYPVYQAARLGLTQAALFFIEEHTNPESIKIEGNHPTFHANPVGYALYWENYETAIALAKARPDFLYYFTLEILFNESSLDITQTETAINIFLELKPELAKEKINIYNASGQSSFALTPAEFIKFKKPAK